MYRNPEYPDEEPDSSQKDYSNIKISMNNWLPSDDPSLRRKILG